MDELSRRRSNGGLLLSRKEPSRIMRDSSLSKEQSPRPCSRLGCCGRVISTNSKEVGFSEKSKPGRISSRSPSNGKEIQGTFSRGFSSVSSARAPLKPPVRKSSARIGTTSDSTGNQAVHTESTDSSSSEAGSSSIGRRSTVRKNFQQNLSSSKEERVAGNNKFGLRGLRSSSSSNLTPLSSLVSNISRKKDGVRKISCEGESSSSSPKGKTQCGLSTSRRSSKVTTRVTIIESQSVNQALPAKDNSSSSIRARRSLASTPRSRLMPGIRSKNQATLNSSQASSQRRSHLNDSYTFEATYESSEPTNEVSRNTRPATPLDLTISRPLNRDNLRRYNIEGIAEVLLALDRIENEEEISYEQLLFLETNLFGVNYFDQHRDMRLDIDNMSYEELLALEERMGSVSTALSEEKLSECIKINIYHSSQKTVTSLVDDGKCCICQEEYINGDEMGCLHCDHRYHFICVQQWLRQKNWCPICKSSANPDSAS